MFIRECLLDTSRLSVTNCWNILVCCRSLNGPSGNQKAGRKATSANVPSQWSSIPSDEQCRSVSLTSTSSEYQEMGTLVEKTIKKSVVTKCIKIVQNPSMWEKYQRYLILTINSTMHGLIFCNNGIRCIKRSSSSLLYQLRKSRKYPWKKKEEWLFPMQILRFFLREIELT